MNNKSTMRAIRRDTWGSSDWSVLRSLRSLQVVTLCGCLLLSFAPSPADTVSCFSCEQETNCMDDVCTGADACFATRIQPRMSSSTNAEPPVFVKGCLSGDKDFGDLLSNRGKESNSCGTLDELARDNGDTDYEVTFCTCSGDKCNRNPEQLAVEQIQTMHCECDGKHCDGQKSCRGQYCTHVTSHDDKGNVKEVKRGCLNDSIPLLIGKRGAACSMPPMIGGMHFSSGVDVEEVRGTVACVCRGEDNCNHEKPSEAEMHPENEKCSTSIKYVLPQIPVNTKEDKKCRGQYCFRARIEAKKSISPDLLTSDTEGCITFTKNTQLDKDFNPTGCLRMKSEQLKTIVCYKSKSPLRSIRRPRARMGKNNNALPKGAGRQSQPKEPDDDESDENEDKDDDDDMDYRKVNDTPPPPPEVKEGNTTLVAIFVLLMICIVVAGLVWKFELHKKIFRARYQTVAGGG